MLRQNLASYMFCQVADRIRIEAKNNIEDGCFIVQRITSRISPASWYHAMFSPHAACKAWCSPILSLTVCHEQADELCDNR
jgi:hypothetical protein